MSDFKRTGIPPSKNIYSLTSLVDFTHSFCVLNAINPSQFVASTLLAKIYLFIIKWLQGYSAIGTQPARAIVIEQPWAIGVQLMTKQELMNRYQKHIEALRQELWFAPDLDWLDINAALHKVIRERNEMLKAHGYKVSKFDRLVSF